MKTAFMNVLEDEPFEMCSVFLNSSLLGSENKEDTRIVSIACEYTNPGIVSPLLLRTFETILLWPIMNDSQVSIPV